MNRGKKLAVLLGITAVLAAAAVWVLRADFNAEVPVSDEEFSIFTQDASAVTGISRTYDGITLRFVKSGGNWIFPEDAAYTVDPQYITDMLDKIADITTSKQITGAGDPAQYGLDSPELSVTIETPEGERTLNFAGEAALSGKKYLDTGDGNVYLVNQHIPEPFELGLTDMIKKDEIPDLKDLRSLTFERGDTVFRLVKDTWTETGTDSDGNETETEKHTWSAEGVNLAVDSGKADALANYVIGLSWQQCVSWNADADELALYGLDSPAAAVTAEYGDGQSFRIYIGNEAGESRYARTDSSKVYIIKGETAERLLNASAEELVPDTEE